MLQIVIVDTQPQRAEVLQSYFRDNSISVQSAESLHEAVQTVGSNNCFFVVLAHCDFLNDSFTSMARLRQNPRVKILFYSTDSRERLRSAPLIPEELNVLVQKVHEVSVQQLGR